MQAVSTSQCGEVRFSAPTSRNNPITTGDPWRLSRTFPHVRGVCGWRGYEREEKEGEREVDNLSTCGCVIQLYLWENTRFIEIREFGWGFLMLTS